MPPVTRTATLTEEVQGDGAAAGAKETVNFCADPGGEKTGFQDMQSAIINILDDAYSERAQLEDTQRAIINILEDAMHETTAVEMIHSALLNILDDSSSEKTRTDEALRAVLNILDDANKETAELRATQRAMINILEDVDAETNERKKSEEEVRMLNKDLEARVEDRTAELTEAVNDLEDFTYSVAHDLRIPLRAIDGFSHILLHDYQDKLDEDGKRLLNVVRNSTQKMGQLIDDMLQFARTRRLTITRSEVDMERLVHTILEELQPSVAGRHLHLEVEHIPPAWADGTMMHQVFLRLLSNAIKFSRSRDPARIKVGGSIEGKEVVYYVKDNGVGFDMQYANKLFGLFQRLHGVGEFEGTGIGLTIVKRIVTRHGGRVWAEGKVNEGATIYFTLPAKEERVRG